MYNMYNGVLKYLETVLVFIHVICYASLKVANPCISQLTHENCENLMAQILIHLIRIGNTNKMSHGIIGLIPLLYSRVKIVSPVQAYLVLSADLWNQDMLRHLCSSGL